MNDSDAHAIVDVLADFVSELQDALPTTNTKLLDLEMSLRESRQPEYGTKDTLRDQFLFKLLGRS